NLITLDPARPRAEALVAQGGRIVAVGDVGAMRERAGPGAAVLAAGGRTVTPGFADAHTHLDLWARARARLSLAGATTRAGAARRPPRGGGGGGGGPPAVRVVARAADRGCARGLRPRPPRRPVVA